MAKTKKAMKAYNCYTCKAKINKGEQYARKSVVIGKWHSWQHDTPVPDWAWQVARDSMPVCKNCNKNNKRG